MKNRKFMTCLALAAALLLLFTAACGQIGDTNNTPAPTDAEEITESTNDASTEAPATEDSTEDATEPEETPEETSYLQESDVTVTETLSDDGSGTHAIEADGESAAYRNVLVTKTGDASGDEADFYGKNAAVFATDGATLTLTDCVIKTDGAHANAVFSYGDGTTVTVKDCVIETAGDCSGGLMTTGGGTTVAENLTVHTVGRSSAAIRSDRGGGTVNVTGGSYVAEGQGSPAIYSTADITVSDAALASTTAQGVVVEGKNSVTLNNVTLVADNNTHNSDKSSFFQAVMIYQSMSGDAAVGQASFTMTGGSLTNKNGDMFFVNNTTAVITLTGVTFVNEDESGVFLRAAAAGWGRSGQNGGKVTLIAAKQIIDGDLIVDSVSSLDLTLSDGSALTGAVNPDNEGAVTVTLTGGSTWALTGDSWVDSLDCADGNIDLNGHTLYVNGEAWSA